MVLDTDKITEAEVSLRLAFFLIERGYAATDVSVALDGAQIQTATTVHFPISAFLAAYGWTKAQAEQRWQGAYSHATLPFSIEVHSRSGYGDVVATLTSGAILRAESKKGSISRSKSSSEYPRIREALGQLLTVEQVEERGMLAVAVPHSITTARLAARWRQAPLIQRCGIRILTVDRNNNVEGLP